MEAPCGKCKRKGCGSYHDVCEEYREYKEEARKKHEKIMEKLLDADFERARFRSMKTNRNSNGVGRSYKK